MGSDLFEKYASLGEWSRSSPGVGPLELKDLETSVGHELPLDLATMLRTHDGSSVWLEDIEENLEEPAHIYCPELRFYSARQCREVLSLTQKWMPDGIPFASDTGPSLYVYAWQPGGWKGIVCAPRGDLGWDSAKPVAPDIESMMNRWQNVLADHRRGRRA